MPAEVGPASAPGGGAEQPAAWERDAFAAIFDAHAAHIFDYCSSLLGDQAEADAATQATLITAYTLSDPPDEDVHLRSWLLALARSECMSPQPGRAEPLMSEGSTDSNHDLAELLAFWQGQADATADTREFGVADVVAQAVPAPPALATLRKLPKLEREALDLVYRHGVPEDELCTVLGISSDDAQAELAAAVTAFRQSAGATVHDFWSDQALVSDGPDVDQIADIPLARMPESLWRRTFRVVFDPDLGAYRSAVAARTGALGSDGDPFQDATSPPPSGRRLVLASILLAGLLLTPAAVGAALYPIFFGSSQASSGTYVPRTTGRFGSNPPSHAQSQQPGVHHASSHPKKPRPGRSSPGVPARGSSPTPKPSDVPSRRPTPNPTITSHPAPSPTPKHSTPPPSPTPTPTPDPTPSPTPDPTPT